MANDKQNEVGLTKLQRASIRLRTQIDDVTQRMSARGIVSSGPPIPQEMMSYIVANQVCMMMSLVEFFDSLEGRHDDS